MTLPDKLNQLLETVKRTLEIISGVGGGQPCHCSLHSVHFSQTFAFPFTVPKAGTPRPVRRRRAGPASKHCPVRRDGATTRRCGHVSSA